ncbi:MAG: DUF4124 domain-containing protein [Gammaproteobacteria bacterium]|nr:DUF4124 domain-containing protein [Gammaproteobacteria bacterium]
MKLLLCLVLSLFMFSTHAELYKWVDKNGETFYSDEPPHENAEQLIPPPLTTTPAIKYKPKEKAKPKEEHAETIYKLFKINSPAQDETIRDNTGNINITLLLEPELDIKNGHTISILVDSQKKIEGSTGLTAGLKNIDRGTHSIQAVIKNKKKKIIKSSNSVTVHVFRQSTALPQHNKFPQLPRNP